MSFKDQVINLIIQGRDLFSAEARKSEQALGELASQSERLNARLTELQNQQTSIRRIGELTRAMQQGEAAFKANSQALDQLVVAQKQAAVQAKQLEQQHQAAAAKLRLLQQAQQQAEQSSEEFNQALQAQQQRLRASQIAAEEAANRKADYTLQVRLARSELNQLGSTLTKQQQEYRQHERALSAAGIAMDQLGDASQQLTQQQAAAELAIHGVNERLSRHDRLLASSSKQAGDFRGSIAAATASLMAMAGAYLGIDRLKSSLVSVLSSGDEAAAFAAQMTALMGSIERGEQATRWIAEFANQTGTRLDSARRGFTSLKTFGIDPMSGALQALTDYSAKLGGGQERLEGIILAVGQAWAKQKLQGEEILQLVERGVPVWDMLATVTGKNSVELQKLSETGQLGRDNIRALFAEMGKQASGQAATSLQRLSGQVAIISNNWQGFKQRIADSGVYQVAVDFLKNLNQRFDDLNKNGQLKQAATDISAFFSAIIQDGGRGVSAALENISAFTRALQITAGSIRLIFNSISAGVSVFGAAVTAYFANLTQGIGRLMALVGADQIGAKLRDTGEMLQAVSAAYKAQIEQDSADIKKAWQAVTGEIAERTREASAAVIAAQTAVTEHIQQHTQQQVDAIQAVANAEEARALKQQELALLMSKAGIVSIESLQAQEQAAKATYDQIDAAYQQGALTAYEVKQAYEAWAQSSLKLAAAQGQAVPEAIKMAAAANNLTGTLDTLVQKHQQLQQSQQGVTEQSAELQRMKLLEAKTYGELVQEYRTTQDELDRLNDSYRRGVVSTEYYIATKERLAQRLGELNRLIGDFTQQQSDTVAAVDRSNQSLREQANSMDRVASATGRAMRFHSLFAESHQYLQQEFDLSSQSTEQLSQRYQELSHKIWQNAQVTGQFWGQLADEFDKGFAREQRIIGQTLQYRELFDELHSGAVTMQRLSQMADIASENLGNLASAERSKLQQAIAAAKRQLRENEQAKQAVPPSVNSQPAERRTEPMASQQAMPSLNSAPVVLVLQVAQQRYLTQIDASTLEQLVRDIRRQQSLGG